MNLLPSFTRLRNESTRAWAIAEKDIRIYYAKPPVLMWGVIMPFFMFLSWSVGRNKPTGALIPSLVAITVFFTSSSIGPVIIPWEKGMRTFERLLAAPVSLTAVLLGKTLAGLIFGIAVALIPLIVGWIVLGAQVTGLLTLGLTLLFAAGAFSSLGVLFSTMPGRDVGSVMVPATLIRWPLLFISGLFIPLGDLGEWGRVVSFISPLTFANDALNGAMGGMAYYTPVLDLTMLAAFWGLFLWVGLRLHEWGRRTES